MLDALLRVILGAILFNMGAYYGFTQCVDSSMHVLGKAVIERCERGAEHMAETTKGDKI